MGVRVESRTFVQMDENRNHGHQKAEPPRPISPSLRHWSATPRLGPEATMSHHATGTGLLTRSQAGFPPPAYWCPVPPSGCHWVMSKDMLAGIHR